MPNPTQNRTTVFVYGTLMRGETRHHSLSDQEFIGTARTESQYRLFLIHDYPGLVDTKDGDGLSILGELWSVDQESLKRLDAIECVDDGLYQRREVRLVGSTAPVDAWFYLQSVEGRVDLDTDWRSR